MKLFFKTIPPFLNWCFIFSLLVIVFKILILNQIEEPVAGLHSLGLVVESILLSLVASYIFYLIVVHYKEYTNSKLISPLVVKCSKEVVTICKKQLKDILNQKEVDFKNITEDLLILRLAEIKPNDQAKMLSYNGRWFNWKNYLKEYKNQTDLWNSKIISNIVFLEAPLVSIIFRIHDSNYFNSIWSLELPLADPSLEIIAKEFYSYCKLCEELENYISIHPWYSKALNNNNK